MTIVIAVLVVLVLIAVGPALATGLRYWRSHQLRSRFGPEYRRVVGATGDRGQAERSLEQRVERRRETPGDPIEERYASREDYLGRVREVAASLVEVRYLLEEERCQASSGPPTGSTAAGSLSTNVLPAPSCVHSRSSKPPLSSAS